MDWHCTDEHFVVEEYLIANCEYPGEWDGAVERLERTDDLVITVTRICPRDRSISFHVISFTRIRGGRIAAMDKYCPDDVRHRGGGKSTLTRTSAHLESN